MIMDERLEFVDGAPGSTAFQHEAGTVNIGDHIDLGHANRNPGKGYPLYLVIVVHTTNDGGAGTAGTIAFQLVSDASDPPLTNGTATVHFRTGTFTAGDLVAGQIYSFPLPNGLPNYERFLALQGVYGEEGEDDLVASAFLTVDPTGYIAYPDAANSNP